MTGFPPGQGPARGAEAPWREGNPARFPALCVRVRGPIEGQHRPGFLRAGLPAGHPAEGPQKGTTYVNTNLPAPGGGGSPRLFVLLLVAAAAAAAAQSEAWANALGTAVTLYSVLTIGSQDRRN